MELRDVPPSWEGLEEGEELRPNQEAGERGKRKNDAILRQAIAMRVLHGRIPLSRDGIKKGGMSNAVLSKSGHSSGGELWCQPWRARRASQDLAL